MLIRAGIAASVVVRLARSAFAQSPIAQSPIAQSPTSEASVDGASDAEITVVVPARNEADRITPLLNALANAPSVRLVIVVDDESTDATGDMAASLGACVVAGTPAPKGWVGKTWALQQGVEKANTEWVVTFDADAMPDPALPGLAVERAKSDGIDLLTLAGRFGPSSAGAGWLNPAMLTTLVYRFGSPGVNAPPSRMLANGQCMVFRRVLFDESFSAVAGHVVEDVAWARLLARRGSKVEFVDAGQLLVVAMYESFADTWRGWGRSIALPGVEARWRQLIDLVILAVVLPLPMVRLLARRADALDALLLAIRVGVLFGTRRAFQRPGIEYWLSPLADGLAWLALARGSVSRHQVWRGRSYAI
jgi:dolichol-phosphate mannosyltransferase